MLPSHTDLTYFLAMANARNITRAAQALGVTQPSLTLSLQRLEHSIGAAVFYRTRHGLKLTPAGEHLLTEARVLMEQWDRLAQRAQQSVSQVSGHLAVGCHPSVARYTLPHILPKWLAKHPQVQLQLEHDLSRKIAQKVIHLEVDVGLIINPVQHPDLILRKIASDQVTFWQSAKLTNPDVLILEPSLTQTQELLRKGKRHGLTFSRQIESSNLEVILSLVESGTGVGILPTRVAQSARVKLTALKAAPQFQDELYVVYRVEQKNSATIKAFVEEILAGFQDSRR